MFKIKKQLLYFSFIILFACSACEQKHVFNEYKTVNIKEWKSTDTLTYNVKIDNDAKQYISSVSVRYQNDYEFSNLWLKISVKGNGIDTSFRFEIPLFKNDGKPYGKKSGSLCTQTIPLKTILPILKKGNYNFSIVQLMRKDPLDGISDVGIIIDK